jgi:hypothetical protein
MNVDEWELKMMKFFFFGRKIMKISKVEDEKRKGKNWLLLVHHKLQLLEIAGVNFLLWRNRVSLYL